MTKSLTSLLLASLLLPSLGGIAHAQTFTVLPMNQGGGCLGIQALDQSSLYILGNNRMLKTADGGMTYTNLPVDPIASYAFFTSPTVGYRLRATSGAPAGMYTAVTKTTDGGMTWMEKRIALANLISVQFSALHFVDGTGFIVGRKGSMMGSRSVTQPLVAKTTDAGETWTEVTGPALGNDGQYTGIHALSATTILLGGSGGIHRSTDGGMTWMPAHVTGAGTYVSRFDFVSATVGFALGSGVGVLKTTDGGQTWTAATTPMTDFRTMDFASASHGAVGGRTASDVAELFVTTDGATTWTKVEFPAGWPGRTGPITCIAYVSPTLLYVGHINSQSSTLIRSGMPGASGAGGAGGTAGAGGAAGSGGTGGAAGSAGAGGAAGSGGAAGTSGTGGAGTTSDGGVADAGTKGMGGKSGGGGCRMGGADVGGSALLALAAAVFLRARRRRRG